MTRRYPTNMPTDFFNLPVKVVLDLGPDIQAFLAEVTQYDEYELGIEEVLSEILVFISEDWRATEGLEALRQSVTAWLVSYDGSDPPENINISNAVHRLGRAMLDQLRHHGLYASDHVLHYRLAKEWVGEESPVLVRHFDFDRKPGG